jgi:dipeptidyl-peptidase 4
MRVARVLAVCVCCVVASAVIVPHVVQAGGPAPARPKPSYEAYLGPASPIEVVAARRADRLVWTAFEAGKRNVYAATAPVFAPVRLTSFLKDDGVDLSGIQNSDDGLTVTFIRGTAPNRDGWVANPSASPDGPERAVWAARVGRAGAWRVAEVPSGPAELSPDGAWVVFVKDGQIYRARVSPVRAAAEVDRGEKPFIREWGVQSAPTWSPDGRRLAFVSTRTDHSFIAVYDVAMRRVTYLAPSVDFDTNPMWSSDGRSIVFVRRPGLTFGQQTPPGGLGVGGGPPGMGARGGTGSSGQGSAVPSLAALKVPGLLRATFRGGYTFSLWKADVATGEAREVWHNQPGDLSFGSMTTMKLAAGDRLVFKLGAAGRAPGGRGASGAPSAEPSSAAGDEWDRYYSLDLAATGAAPVVLTTTDGLIEDASSVALSGDGRTLYYCTNAGDIERRHIWSVPVTGGTPARVSAGSGIETRPVPLPSGAWLATLSADWKTPQSLGIWPLAARAGAAQRLVFPASRPGFPADAHVEPQLVVTKAADGLEIHNQLYLPADLRPGEKRSAIIFVHGGPARQMLLGYHYMQFYHWAYAINQWLANQGYIVLSVNYRSGIGYGRSFRGAPATGAAGNAEYQDVVAGARYLLARPDVDAGRVGIWGLSYGGLLTSQALARNSDIFKAGVDLAGVHLWGSSLDPDAVSYKSSTISAIDGWTSPVLLVHGDDDRNVAFQQTTGLVSLLRQRDVYFELIVFPDDTHESMLFSRWLYTLGRMDAFLKRFLQPDTR